MKAFEKLWWDFGAHTLMVVALAGGIAFWVYLIWLWLGG